jgi:hypothetical protein
LRIAESVPDKFMRHGAPSNGRSCVQAYVYQSCDRQSDEFLESSERIGQDALRVRCPKNPDLLKTTRKR